jgi:hypothetical protein
MSQIDELDQNVAIYFNPCLIARLVGCDLRFRR